MPLVLVLRPRVVPGAIRKPGWGVARQRGSHIILTKSGHPVTHSVPDHPQVARGTLRALINRAGFNRTGGAAVCIRGGSLRWFEIDEE